MGDIESEVARHYGAADLLERIAEAVRAEPGQPIDREALSQIDEFHIGGAAATLRLIESLPITAESHILDIGCGIGGPARLIAAETGARVTGIDLTETFVRVAEELSRRTGQGERLRFLCGSALDMPFDEGSFDLATLLHVGMNIADKEGLMREAARVLRAGRRLAVYDVMQTGSGAPDFPVPWAASAATSFLARPDEYADWAAKAGFEVMHECQRREEALDFFADRRAWLANRRASGLPPPAGLNLVMGADAAAKIANLTTAIEQGHIAPVEMIFRKTRPGA